MGLGLVSAAGVQGGYDELERILAKRIAEQVYRDKLAQQKFENDLEIRKQSVSEDSNRLTRERLNRNDDELAQQRAYTRADQLTDDLEPDVSLNPGTSAAIRAGGLGGFIRTNKPYAYPPFLDEGSDGGAIRSTIPGQQPGEVFTGKGSQLRQRRQDAQTAADREADNTRLLAAQQEAARHNRAMEQRPVAGNTVLVHTVDENGNPITRIVPKTPGSEFGAPPTADMRNKVEARRRVQTSIQAIEDLSKRVITKRGIAQRATATGRSVEAVLGNDPEYRTYQDARMALAGNLAVAQQGSRPSDADIRAIWLPMVPDTFADTDESAAMKWNLIRTMQNVDKGSQAVTGVERWVRDPVTNKLVRQ